MGIPVGNSDTGAQCLSPIGKFRYLGGALAPACNRQGYQYYQERFENVF
jgi:hypothetical protein